MIGVVADAPYVTLDDPTPRVVFRPIMQETARTQFPMAYVRAKGDLATVREGYTRVVKPLGHRSLRTFITSAEWVDGALVRERFTAALATFAAALTALLACIGVYGLLAYSVTARTREIGVRVALGATRRNVVRMIVRDGLAIGDPRRAHWRSVRVGCCTVRTSPALRHRPRRSPNAAARRGHPPRHSARRVAAAGAACVEGGARRSAA